VEKLPQAYPDTDDGTEVRGRDIGREIGKMQVVSFQRKSEVQKA
jgi:hypothetical protein